MLVGRFFLVVVNNAGNPGGGAGAGDAAAAAASIQAGVTNAINMMVLSLSPDVTACWGGDEVGTDSAVWGLLC